MDFKTYEAMITLYEHNFRMLHWNASGDKFYTIHEKAGDCYEHLGETLDKITEMGIRMGVRPESLPAIISHLGDNTDNFVVVESEVVADYDNFCELTAIMLNDILKGTAEVLQSEQVQSIENVGIKSALEAIYEEYDLCARYLHVRFSADAKPSSFTPAGAPAVAKDLDDGDIDNALDMSDSKPTGYPVSEDQ